MQGNGNLIMSYVSAKKLEEEKRSGTSIIIMLERTNSTLGKIFLP